MIVKYVISIELIMCRSYFLFVLIQLVCFFLIQYMQLLAQ